MKIYFGDARVFAAAHVPQLRRVFWRLSIGQHEAVIKDTDALLASPLYTTAGSLQQGEWREVIERAALQVDRSVDPTRPPRGLHARIDVERAQMTVTCRFPLEPGDAASFAESPLRLLLENERDWSLFVAAARVHGRTVTTRAVEQDWLQPFGCGGTGEVLNRVRERDALHRRFVFVDSDPPNPGTIVKIQKQCAQSPPIPCHVAKKRELENYVPGSVWRRLVWAAYRPAKGARRASRPQRPEHRALLEWEALSPAEKDQDDVKTRFEAFNGKDENDNACGTPVLAVRLLTDATACARDDFVDRNGTELDEVLRELEGWL